MEKQTLQLKVVEDLRSLANTLEALVNLTPHLTSQGKEEKPYKQVVTLEEVRGVLARKSQEGFTAQIKSIIQRFDAEKLSDVNPQDYEEIMLLAEELSHD